MVPIDSRVELPFLSTSDLTIISKDTRKAETNSFN